MISKRTIVILNVTLLVFLAAAFLGSYMLGLSPQQPWRRPPVPPYSFISPCPISGNIISVYSMEKYCIGSFPIELVIVVVWAISSLILLPILFFIDIFWLIRRFVKKQ